MHRRQVIFGLPLAAAFAPAELVCAQSNNTIRIIFPYAAGGSGDATIRLIADKMQASLNQPVVVENRTGGAGRIGVSAVKNAAPDGLTLLYTPFVAVTIYPFVYRTLDYDPFTDLPPLAQLVNLRTAKSLGLTVPLALLGRADEVIE